MLKLFLVSYILWGEGGGVCDHNLLSVSVNNNFALQENEDFYKEMLPELAAAYDNTEGNHDGPYTVIEYLK